MSKSKPLSQLMDLSGRVALVTGGAGHLGAEIIATLAELGADVAIVDADEPRCIPLAEEISTDFGVHTLPLITNIAEDAQVKEAVEETVDTFGRLDIVINAAAFVGTTELEGWAVPFEKQSAETWRKAIDVNLTSAFVLSQATAPHLRASGHGTLINVASIYGVVGPDMRLYDGLDMGNPAAYGASKGGLLQLTRWLATALAPDIRVNAITPGGISRGQNPSFVDKYNARVPLDRMATEEEMKGAIAYLASDLSTYVTGQNLIVDGGWTAW
jgi:NAD(P)-dependent dehydrogenase (short-subunit alcohol dehydrogenase family)